MTCAGPARIVRVAAAGDSALVLELPARIDPTINGRATGIAVALRRQWGAILRDVVVGYATVTVYFDPLRVDGRWLEAEIRSVAEMAIEQAATDGTVVEVPVCYEGELAPDLGDVASFAGCSPEEVVALHSGPTYRVYMVGFIPGFAYLAEVDARIAAPRRTTPRSLVPAGAVAIAGAQTGVYPSATPGGWNIIGRTPLRPYDPDRHDPFLFHAGDSVRFQPMSREEFDRGR